MLGLGGEPWSSCPNSCLFTTPERAVAMLCLVTIVSLVLGRVGNCHALDSVTRYCKVWLRFLLEQGDQEGQVREKGHPICAMLLGAGSQPSLQKLNLV